MPWQERVRPGQCVPVAMGHTHPSSTNMKHNGGIKHASAFKHVEENANPGEDAHVRLVVEALAPRLDQMGGNQVLNAAHGYVARFTRSFFRELNCVLCRGTHIGG